MSTADINSPGNYGILDQAMALKWIYENADNFNGNRDSITLFGPGAGAASAGLLMVSPDTRHIVSKVIAQVSLRFHFKQFSLIRFFFFSRVVQRWLIGL